MPSALAGSAKSSGSSPEVILPLGSTEGGPSVVPDRSALQLHHPGLPRKPTAWDTLSPLPSCHHVQPVGEADLPGVFLTLLEGSQGLSSLASWPSLQKQECPGSVEQGPENSLGHLWTPSLSLREWLDRSQAGLEEASVRSCFLP